MTELNPVLIKVLWSRLVSAVDEAALGLLRTCYSMVVRDFNDYCVGVFDAKGNMLAHSSKTTPGFIGMMPFVMQNFLKEWPASELSPGDILITNDPWTATGHNNDITLATPIFAGDRLIGFSVCVVHHLDIGGRMASLESRDMYEEGLRIPVLKLYSRGKPNEAIFQFIRSNVRMSHKVLGDLAAQTLANDICSRGVLRMVEEYQFEDLQQLSTTIIELARNSLSEKIWALPNGIYRHAIMVPPVGSLKEHIELRVAIEIADGKVTIDYEGSSSQVEAAINVTLPFTTSYSMFPLKAALDPTVPNNAGCSQPITVRAPKGSVLNCEPPAPTFGRTFLAHLLPEMVIAALAPALGEKRIAACGSTPLVSLYFNGQKPTKAPFLAIVSHMGGFGASNGKDGYSALAFPGNTASIPVEVTESDTCLVYLKKEFAPNTGGPGRRRGGLGQDIRISVATGRNAPPAPVIASIRGSIRSPDSTFPVFGCEGGAVGRGGELYLNDKPAEHGITYRLHAGDSVRLVLPGGGGYGDPLTRDPEAVRDDARAGLITVDGAREDYGVVLSGEDLSIDPAATKLLRSGRASGSRTVDPVVQDVHEEVR